MATVSSSLNPGVADMLKSLSNVNSPALNSPAVINALEKAPTSDIVQLSTEAIQLQSVDALFGISTTTPTSTMSSLLESLAGNSTTPTSSSSPANSVLANASPADQFANAQAAVQAQLTQGLFGTGINTSLPGSLFSTLG
jgi:hypothetical protein